MKLKTAEEMWGRMADPHITDEEVMKLLNDHTAQVEQYTAQRCADAAEKAWHDGEQRPCWLSDITNAILAVAQPPETERERLGRKLWNAKGDSAYMNGWESIGEVSRESYMHTVDIIRDEQRKIEAEASE